MQLAELTVRGFADLLGSDAPAPGGGSAAALAGTLGAALTAMVGSLTVGRKKYAEFDGLARETLEKARDLEHRFLDVMERDTEAFRRVCHAQGHGSGEGGPGRRYAGGPAGLHKDAL